MFGLFKKKPARLEPESRWVVTVEGDRINVRDEAGRIKYVATGDLSGVVVETNDTGPWGADVWWLLFDASDRVACAFPQGATGEKGVVDYLSALPGFDHGEMIKAMISTDNAVFALWRRPA